VSGLVADIIIAPDFWPYLYNIDSHTHPVAVYGPYVSCAANAITFLILLGRPTNHAGTLPHTAVLFGALADLGYALAGHSPASLNIAAHLFAALANLYVLRTLHVVLIRQPFLEATAIKEDMERLAENNARLFRESEEQRNMFEDILANVGMIISSQLNLRETLDAIADMVADMMRARQCVIALFTEDRSALKVAATYGMNTPPDYLPLADSPAAMVCETQTALTVEDLLLRPELFRPQLVFTSIRSVIAAPLVNDHEIIGVVEAYSSEKGAFTQRDVLLLKALGYHAGAAVAGATLHKQTKARLDEEQYLYRISQAAAATVDTDTILEQCLPFAAQALEADFALAFLASGQTDTALTFKASAGLSFRPADIDLGAYPELNALVRTMVPAMLPTGDSPPLAGLMRRLCFRPGPGHPPAGQQPAARSDPAGLATARRPAAVRAQSVRLPHCPADRPRSGKGQPLQSGEIDGAIRRAHRPGQPPQFRFVPRRRTAARRHPETTAQPHDARPRQVQDI
jgi:GAF domain-containing protein